MATRKPLSIAEINAAENHTTDPEAYIKLVRKIPNTPFQNLLALYGACRFARIWVNGLTPRQAWERVDQSTPTYIDYPRDWRYWILTEIFEVPGDQAQEWMFQPWSWKIVNHAYTITEARMAIYEAMMYAWEEPPSPQNLAMRKMASYAYDVWYMFRTNALYDEWLELRRLHQHKEFEQEQQARAQETNSTPTITPTE